MYHPLERVGVYVPGGKASYPSTVLMTVTLAKVAGVEDISVVTPPQPVHKHRHVLKDDTFRNIHLYLVYLTTLLLFEML